MNQEPANAPTEIADALSPVLAPPGQPDAKMDIALLNTTARAEIIQAINWIISPAPAPAAEALSAPAAEALAALLKALHGIAAR